MKATGIVRNIDNEGRIVIPKELCTIFNIRERDPLEVFVDDSDAANDSSAIILRKYEPACTFTSSAVSLVEFNGKKVSKDAVYDLIKLFGITEIPA